MTMDYMLHGDATTKRKLGIYSTTRFIAALTQAKWLNAWGKFPICSPEIAISSEKMPK